MEPTSATTQVPPSKNNRSSMMVWIWIMVFLSIWVWFSTFCGCSLFFNNECATNDYECQAAALDLFPLTNVIYRTFMWKATMPKRLAEYSKMHLTYDDNIIEKMHVDFYIHKSRGPCHIFSATDSVYLERWKKMVLSVYNAMPVDRRHELKWQIMVDSTQTAERVLNFTRNFDFSKYEDESWVLRRKPSQRRFQVNLFPLSVQNPYGPLYSVETRAHHVATQGDSPELAAAKLFVSDYYQDDDDGSAALVTILDADIEIVRGGKSRYRSYAEVEDFMCGSSDLRIAGVVMKNYEVSAEELMPQSGAFSWSAFREFGMRNYAQQPWINSGVLRVNTSYWQTYVMPHVYTYLENQSAWQFDLFDQTVINRVVPPSHVQHLSSQHNILVRNRFPCEDDFCIYHQIGEKTDLKQSNT